VFGNTTPTYSGAVSVSSNDPNPLATFAAVSNAGGVYTFTGTLDTVNTSPPGTETITATDGTYTGTEAVTVTPAATSTFAIGYPTTTGAGISHTFTITAKDAFGNLTPAYTGQVSVSSDDPNPLAVFAPTPYTFTGSG